MSRIEEIEARLNADEQAFIEPGYIGDDQCMQDRRFLLAELRKLQAKLEGPCGSCHPCTEWANQTWVNAGERLPHVHEWQEMKTKLRAYETAHAMVSDWAGRSRTGFYDEAQDDVVQIIRTAAATGTWND